MIAWRRKKSGCQNQSAPYLVREIKSELEHVQTIDSNAARANQLHEIDKLQLEEDMISIRGQQAVPLGVTPASSLFCMGVEPRDIQKKVQCLRLVYGSLGDK